MDRLERLFSFNVSASEFWLGQGEPLIFHRFLQACCPPHQTANGSGPTRDKPDHTPSRSQNVKEVTCAPTAFNLLTQCFHGVDSET